MQAAARTSRALVIATCEPDDAGVAVGVAGDGVGEVSVPELVSVDVSVLVSVDVSVLVSVVVLVEPSLY